MHVYVRFHFMCFSPLTNLRPYNIWNTHMHPRELTWTPKLPMLERRFLFQTIIFMGFLGLVTLWYSTRAIHSWISPTTSRISARSSKALSHCRASCSTGHLFGLKKFWNSIQCRESLELLLFPPCFGVQKGFSKSIFWCHVCKPIHDFLSQSDPKRMFCSTSNHPWGVFSA